MNIESTRKDIPHDGAADAGAWGSIKRWGSDNPGLSRVIIIALILLAVAGVIWFFYPKQTATRGGFGGGAGGPQPVGVATVVSGPINITLNALGTVTPLATATVRPQVSGLLTEFYFTEGQLVKKGDPLAQIDPRPYQAALDQAKGQLTKDSSALAGAQRDLKRYQALLALNAESQQAVDDQMATVSTDEGIVESDKANVETAAINLGYTRIVSPVDGQVGLHQVDIGNILSAGQTTGVVVVTELSPMSILFTVPEDSISQVMARVKSGATLTADAYDRSQTNKIASGQLATVDNEVDPTTGTVKLRAMFDNTDGSLFPSQFVNIHLLVDTLQNQMIIPVSAVQRGADGTFVFVVTPDKVANARDVKLGVQDGDKVAVLSGLKVGETVVVDGADRLRDGADVTIPNPGKQPIIAAAGAGNDARAKARAATQALITKACAPDIQKFCAGQAAAAARRCLFQNRDSLSGDCTAAMAKARRPGAGGAGGRRGGGGGGP